VIRVWPAAEIDADFPLEEEVEGADYAELTGRGFAEAVAEMVRASGYKPSPLYDLGLGGWELEVPVGGKKAVWLRLQDPGGPYLLDTTFQESLGIFGKSDNAPYAELLSRLNDKFSKDERIKAVRWMLAKDILTEARGAQHPLIT
jgi:hypothetical protein